MRYSLFPTAWGTFGFVTDCDRLVATYLPQPASAARRRIAEQWPEALEDNDALPKFRAQVESYFEGRRVKFSVKVDVSRFTPFQQAILEACRRTPYGQTASYADLARAAGKPGAARAVGTTMARNPLPLVIPCHRVVRSDGSIGGFSSPDGVDEKQRLLRLEGNEGRQASVLPRRAGRAATQRSRRLT